MSRVYTQVNHKNMNNLLGRVTYRLKVENLDGTVSNPRPTRKTQITRSSVLTKMKSAYLRVHYAPDVYNDGTFTSRRDLLDALNAWTDEQQLKYVYGGEW